jgi:hypothetical protein
MKLARTFVFRAPVVRELLVDLKERRRCWNLKEETPDDAV